MVFRLLALAAAGAFLLDPSPVSRQQPPGTWRSTFDVDRRSLGPSGRNDYFTLEPGRVSVFESGDERLTITVLDDTRVVDGVTTRVIEERETQAGRLVEVSRNFFAIDSVRHDVYYFGEEVDIYKNGKVIDHEGAWVSGTGGAKFGLMMPATPALNDRFYQEVAPRIAMDRSEVVALDAKVTTPAGVFTPCVRVRETTPLEPGATEYKYYARGTGLVQDGSLLLVSVAGPPEPTAHVR